MDALKLLEDREDDSLPTADDAPDAGCIALEGVAIFARVTGCLGVLRRHLTAMAEDLEGYAALASGGDSANAAAGMLAERAQDAAAAWASAADADANASCDEDARHAKQYLFAIVRAAQTLSAVATLTRATAGSLGVTTLTGYLNDLARIAGLIRDDARVVDEKLGALTLSRSRLRESFVDVHRQLETMTASIVTAQDDTAHLQAMERAAVEKVEGETQRLRDRGRTRMKSFVTAVQFSDRLAQRLDHLAVILAHDDPHTRRLGAAHIRSIIEVIHATASDVAAGADDISDIGAAGGDLFRRGDVAESIRASVVGRARVAEQVTRDLAVVDRVLSGARSGADDARLAGKAAEARFRDLETSAKEVATASVNSTLLASRAGRARAALSTLSLEVRLVATQCLAAVGGCHAAMNRLMASNEETQSMVLAQVEALSAALTEYRAEVDLGAGRIDALTTLCDRAAVSMAEILNAVGNLREIVSEMSGLTDALAFLAQGLATSDAPASAPDPAILAAIWDIYTMDEERAVHAELFAEFGASGSAEQAAVASDDIDDIFF